MLRSPLRNPKDPQSPFIVEIAQIDRKRLYVVARGENDAAKTAKKAWRRLYGPKVVSVEKLAA